MDLHRPSSLLAVGLSDFSIRIIDIVARNVVRVFDGHDGQLTDIAFSQVRFCFYKNSIWPSLKPGLYSIAGCPMGRIHFA